MPDETTTYLALLRGINVGGSTKVDMKTLKAVFEDLGWAEVSTYINSGNVIFLTAEMDTPDVLESVVFDPAIENVLHAHGALIWNVSRDNSPRGSALKVRGADAYREMTARNVNTVRKLRALIEALD